MSSRTEVGDAALFNTLSRRKWKCELIETIPADNFPIGANFPPVLIFTPAGAIDVLMPAVTADLRGLVFWIYNQGAGGVITLKTSADAAFSPAITLAINTGRMVICNGTTWRQVI